MYGTDFVIDSEMKSVAIDFDAINESFAVYACAANFMALA